MMPEYLDRDGLQCELASKAINNNRELALAGEITMDTYAELSNLLAFMDTVVSDITPNKQSRMTAAEVIEATTVTLMINSFGGDFYAMVGMIAAMEIAKAKKIIVRTVGTGFAGSAAFILLAAGSPGYRYAHRWCTLMSHGVCGDLASKRSTELVYLQEEELLTAYTRLKKADRKKILSNGDHYWTATEAKEFGAVDFVIQNGEALP